MTQCVYMYLICYNVITRESLVICILSSLNNVNDCTSDPWFQCMSLGCLSKSNHLKFKEKYLSTH